MKNLILIVTRNCNLRCDYWDVVKKNIFMTKRVARKATLFYLDLAEKNKEKNIKIRFFGGEPLLEWDLIKDTVVFAKNNSISRRPSN